MNKKVFAGCCGVLVLAAVLIGVALLWLSPRVVEKGKKFIGTQIVDVSRNSAIEGSWQPPSEKPDARWFPTPIETWTLEVHEEIASVPEIDLDRGGHRAKYRGDKQDIDIIVIAANELEREGIYSRARAKLTKNATNQMTSEFSGRLYVRTGGDNHTRLWWIKGWLFIFRTRGPDDPSSFAQAYLEAMIPTPAKDEGAKQ
jgi:hypothetical protein